jgi:sugar lactone lactonase YvrE
LKINFLKGLSFLAPFLFLPYLIWGSVINEKTTIPNSVNHKAKLIHRISFPAKNITNCTFGGKNNNELFVTSATKGMNSAELRKYRYSGSLFSVKTNSKGILQKKFVLSDEKKRSLL